MDSLRGPAATLILSSNQQEICCFQFILLVVNIESILAIGL